MDDQIRKEYEEKIAVLEKRLDDACDEFIRYDNQLSTIALELGWGPDDGDLDFEGVIQKIRELRIKADSVE